MRHCYTEQSHQLERLKQCRQGLEEEKASVEASCRRLEEELHAVIQQANEKDAALASSLTNIQTAKRELGMALEGMFVLFVFFLL